MTDTALLLSIIAEKGIKKGKIASAIEVSYSTLKRKIENKAPFKAIEIQIICDLLGVEDTEMKDAIFFANNIGK